MLSSRFPVQPAIRCPGFAVGLSYADLHSNRQIRSALQSISFVPPFSQFLWGRLRLPIATFLCVFAIGAMGYRILENWGWDDCFYMTIITVSTVGFKEVHELGPSGKLFTMALIVMGVGTIAYAGFMLGRVLLEEELANLLRGRRMQREIEDLAGHVIVCGCGRSGRQAVEELRASQVTVLAIDADEAKLAAAPNDGVLRMKADATDENVLKEARVEKARGLIAALPKDADNVFVVLTAREMNPNITIVARATEEGAVSKLRRAGAQRVISPDAIGGRRLVAVLLRPHVIEFINTLTGGETGALVMEEFSVKAGSEVVGKTLRDWSVRSRTGANIVGIKRSGEPIMINPAADTSLAADDILIALGKPENLKKLAELL